MRARQDIGQKKTAVKTQVQKLLKRHGIEKAEGIGGSWSKRYRHWLNGLAADAAIGCGLRTNLASLLRQLEFLEKEIELLDEAVRAVGEKRRWKPVVNALRKESGVGLLASVKFATEIGDFARFRRARQTGAYFGWTPASHESGDASDRKGHITREGSPSMRQILCQATWSRVRHDKGEREVYRRLVQKNPKKRKIALVACMRRLTVRLWHVGLTAQKTMN